MSAPPDSPDINPEIGNNPDGVAAAQATNPNNVVERKQIVVTSYTYPSNLGDESIRHFTQIEIVGTARARDATDLDAKTNTRIYLPIPVNLSNSFGAGWDTLNYNVLENEAYKKGERVQDAKGLIDAAGTLISDGYYAVKREGLGGIASDAAGFIKKLSERGGLKGLSAFQAGQALQAGARIGVRNYSAQQFNGMGQREFTLSWKLTAKSKAETGTIKRIEDAIKQYMHPELAENDQLVRYPKRFRVKFYSASVTDLSFANSETTSQSGFKPTLDDYTENKYLPKYKDLVLLSANFDYNPSGIVSFSRLNAPLEVSVTLAFREAELNFAKEFETGVVR